MHMNWERRVQKLIGVGRVKQLVGNRKYAYELGEESTKTNRGGEGKTVGWKLKECIRTGREEYKN